MLEFCLPHALHLSTILSGALLEEYGINEQLIFFWRGGGGSRAVDGSDSRHNGPVSAEGYAIEEM
jgi:hypothetical protein